MTRQRLQKLMAACGVASRRESEQLIAQGRVQVDGRIVTELGTQVDPDAQEVRCDGRLLRPEPQLHYLLNKPRGAICSLVTRSGSPRAVDFLPPRARDRRLYTIGRLDVDSEGAIILTNDGELCHLVSHPRFGVRKTYRVEVEGQPDEAALERMRRGIWLAEGRTGAVEIELLHAARDRSQLAVTLSEGRRREIRRIFARFGHEVRRLVRIAIGPVQLGSLPSGASRILLPEEVAALHKSASAVIRLGGSRSRPAARGHAAAARGGPASREGLSRRSGARAKQAAREQAAREQESRKPAASRSAAGKPKAGKRAAGKRDGAPGRARSGRTGGRPGRRGRGR